MRIQRRSNFLLVWLSVNTLGLGFILYLSGWVEGSHIKAQEKYLFDNSSFPGLATIITTGLLLGLMQWEVLKRQFKISIRWLLGAAIGFWITAITGAFLHFLAVFEFRKFLTDEEVLFQVTCSAIIAGALGGAASGFVQGWSIRSCFSWSIINSIGWALGWSAGRVLNYQTGNAHWYLPGFSASAKIAIQLAALGLVSGLISSAITGFSLLKLLGEREQT